MYHALLNNTRALHADQTGKMIGRLENLSAEEIKTMMITRTLTIWNGIDLNSNYDVDWRKLIYVLNST